MRVLLLDEGFISGTVTARGLERAGCQVDVMAATGGRGRCATAGGTWRLAPPADDPALPATVDALVRDAAAAGQPYNVVYPVTEPLQWLVWDARPAWQALVFPQVAVPARAARRDKRCMGALAAAAGVHAPTDHSADTNGDVERAAQSLGLPLVIKGVRGRGGSTTHICATVERARAAARRVRAVGVVPFAQAYVAGATYLAGGLWDQGRPLRFYAGVKTAQYPAHVGPAAELTSTDDPALAEAAARVAAAAGVAGLASMDFVRDAGGRYHFLELNPRPWGSIAAAARAGVDLFGPLVALWRAEAPAPNLALRADVRTPVFPLYLLAAGTWRSGVAARALLPDARRVFAFARREPALAAHLVHRLVRVGRRWAPSVAPPRRPEKV